MNKHLVSMVTVALFTNGCSSDDVQNRCISDYPNISHETLSYPSGSVANIEGIEWFEDGVKQITLKSRAVIMVRPLNLPLPAVGSKLELRSFIKNPGDAPFAGCYCQVGTDICLEEYTYP